MADAGQDDCKFPALLSNFTVWSKKNHVVQLIVILIN